MADQKNAPEPSALTAEAEKQYVEAGAGRCPFCKSHSIEGSSFDFVDTCVWQEVFCYDCKAEWQDIYELKRVQVNRNPEPAEGAQA